MWHEVRTTEHARLYENRTLEVWSIPLRHRVPCAGFLFREKEPPLNVNKSKIAKYGLSIAQIAAAKRGEAVRLDDGTLLGNGELTYRPYAPRSYAYLSDTNFSARAAELCRGADLMYHEATYAAAERKNRPRTRPLDHRGRREGRPQGGGPAARDRPLLVALQGRRGAGRGGPAALPGELRGAGRSYLYDRKTTMTKAEIQLVRALADKRGRAEHGLFVAEGAKLIGELRASHLRVRRIYALEGVFDGPGVETVSPREMERLSLLKTPSNSLATVEIPRYRLDAERLGDRLALALDEVQNPGNLGTIIRLADWFGIGEIVCSPGSADCFNPKVVQATMGAILRVRVHYAELAPLLARAAGRGTPVYGTFLEGRTSTRPASTDGGESS